MEQKKNNFKIVSDKKARIILPNAITLIGVCLGLTSINYKNIKAGDFNKLYTP